MKVHSLTLAFCFAGVGVLAGPSPAQSEGPVKIGVLGVHSQVSNTNDNQMLEAARLVAANWNSRVGVDGYQVALVVETCTGDPRSIPAAIGNFSSPRSKETVSPIRRPERPSRASTMRR